eukprot:10618925-Alexandrium_andersonii.AAC.1
MGPRPLQASGLSMWRPVNWEAGGRSVAPPLRQDGVGKGAGTEASAAAGRARAVSGSAGRHTMSGKSNE